MKRVLILGGSHRDIPLIKASQKLGYYVITLGDRDYYLGHNYSNKALKINFNDLDAVEKVMIDENIDYLLPGSGEESYLNTVRLSKKLNIGNFDTLEVAQLVHNKWRFKEFCLANEISTPNGYYYNSNSNLTSLDFPIVVKPTNLSGGRGVDVVDNVKELEISICEAQEISSEIFLEEFIEGELIAYSIFIKSKKVIYSFVGRDDTYENKYLITTAYPITIKNHVLNKLQNDVEKLAQLLSLVDGMFHLQVIIKNNIPYIIDVTRRIPGDFYPNLIEYSDGVEYSKAVVKSYIGESINDEFKVEQEQEFIIRHCVMSNKNGTYQDIFIEDTLKDKVIFQFNLFEKNRHINDYLNTQIAIVFIKLSCYDEYIVNNINKLIYPKVN